MGKKNDGYQNFAAKRFKDPQRVTTMSEEEIYDILEKDIFTILKQLADYQECQNAGSYHERKKKKNHKGFVNYPNYTKNMFNNLSAAKFIYEFVECWKNGDIELRKPQREALKMLISTAYRDTISKNKIYPIMDDDDRCVYLCEAFRMLDKKNYKLALKLTKAETKKASKLRRPEENKTKQERKEEEKLRKAKAKAHACELIIQAYQDPKHGCRSVVREFDKRNMPDKKKLKLLKKLYGDRYYEACGCILGIEGGSSDMVATVKDQLNKMKKKERKKVLRAFGDYFKQFGKRSFLLDSRFYDKHKKIIKKLISEDIGYKKAFIGLKEKKPDIDVKKPSRNSSGDTSSKSNASSSMKAEDRLAAMLKG